MAKFTLDHVFCFCEPTLVSEIKNTNNAGFTLNSEVHHPGQGTANRSIIFEENYLEFIYVNSIDDANQNPLKLARRAEWSKSGASPFGICLRSAIPENELNQFWTYSPPYWPEGSIFINKLNEESPEQPLFFVIPSSVRPVDRPKINHSMITHETKSTAILKVEIMGPDYEWPQKMSACEQVILTKADFPHMRVTIDGQLPREIFLNDLVSIVSAEQLK